mgnify:FL=1
MTRPYRRRTIMGEMQMVTEYVMRAYPGATVFFRLRLGTLAPLTQEILTPEEARAATTPFASWADAVVATDRELIIIEGKMRSHVVAIAQLQLYAGKARETPDLRPYARLPIALEMVVSIEDPAITAMARQQGIRVAVYRPAWLPEWIAARRRRETRPQRS